MSTPRRKRPPERLESLRKSKDSSVSDRLVEQDTAFSPPRSAPSSALNAGVSSRKTPPPRSSSSANLSGRESSGEQRRTQALNQAHRRNLHRTSKRRNESAPDSALLRYIGLPLAAGLGFILLGLIVSCAAAVTF